MRPGAALAFNAAVVGCAPAHPALEVPDGESHRGGPMVAADIEDPAVVEELGRRYRSEKDFERGQEYFLRLLDHFLFSKDRLTGMTRKQVEDIFGPGMEADRPGRRRWGGGRDSLVIEFEEDRVVWACHIQGY